MIHSVVLHKKFIETEFNFLEKLSEKNASPHQVVAPLPIAALIDNASCQHHFGTPYSCQNLVKALEWARRKPGNPIFDAKACWRTVHTLRADIRKYFDSNPGCHFHLQSGVPWPIQWPKPVDTCKIHRFTMCPRILRVLTITQTNCKVQCLYLEARTMRLQCSKLDTFY